VEPSRVSVEVEAACGEAESSIDEGGEAGPAHYY
jgi:hypothetical protein